MSQINRLSELIRTQQSKTSFICGGTIAVRTDKNDSDISWTRIRTQPMQPSPINIYWTSKDKGGVNKVTLPIEGDGDSKEISRVKKLVCNWYPTSWKRPSRHA
ncbi:hypothetical protein BGW36DRAFT_443084 [Talaromyces proteolyticus]|uniref:Uncharacterized protein n=1 Tax=Talaromyces proteolyticus TaxID=1131652 RepID=A0AAD4KY65_9EURO|nr:uncharacterized protein BGW36DRAFT_443084 [Talaromyces proteolyticus]KAH8703087.1 hypothetical protein BGW36DRAFT_443084 [Talaromyces proteolyticus]